MTDQVNPTLTTIEDMFKDLVWNALVKLALSRLFAMVPFLAWGPLGAIAGYVFGLFADKLFEALKLAIDLKAIAFVSEAHRAAFDKASVTLAIIARDNGTDSDEYRKANENAKEALATFVRFTG